MARYRAQLSVPVDSTLPKDRMVITPCFKDTGTSDPDGIADDLATGFQSWVTGSLEVTAKLYDLDATGPGPHRPVAEKTVGAGLLVASTMPRELACCLSFYAGTNTARRRGRLYIPITFLNRKTPGGAAQRPSAQQRADTGTLAAFLAGIGGLDVDWVVWSGRDNDAHTVTNWWVDDEWDIQRRRGLRPTTRTSGTTSG